MASTQVTLVSHSNLPPPYAFLAQAPPVQKKRPTQPLPSPPGRAPTPPARRRSSTFSHISSWAAHVQPGSPAAISPPLRRPSVSSQRRPSIPRAFGCRPSISHSRAPSGSFLNLIDTPTSPPKSATSPSFKEFRADLVALGYTSLFVRFPRTPVTPERSRGKQDVKPAPISDHLQDNSIISGASAQNNKTPVLKRFRSLSVLKPLVSRSRSKSDAMPSKSSKSSPPTPAVQPQKNALNVANRKKAKYPCPKPAPLDNDLALMQFMGGGSMDRNVKMMMEAQAKAAASSGRPIGVGDVYRDAQGRIWWDQEEEWEYAHLLAGSQPVGACVAGTDWVQFGEESDKENDDRRGSVCTVDSLDARYAIRPTDEQDNLVAFGSRRASHRHGQPIVSSPPRPRYTSKHPHQPQFVLDVAFPHSPTDPKGKYTSAPIDPYAHANHKSRRRPEPLKLAPLSPGPRRPSNSPYDHEKLRRDFLDNSFEPQPAPRSAALPPAPHHSVSHAPGRGKMGFANLRPSFAASMETLTLEKTKSKPSRLNMLFRRKD